MLLLALVLPLFSGALFVLIGEKKRSLKFALNLLCILALLINNIFLLVFTEHSTAYTIAGWPAPFSIVLYLDSLAIVMLLLTSIMALACLIFSWTRWSRVGVHFHSLLQFLLLGMNGTFLTGDLFNLFVFFEIMLASSYGLILHAYDNARIRAGLKYLIINLVGSCFFLMGIALIYNATGALNLADIASQIAGLEPTQRLLLHTGFALLALTFLTKSAIWPLGFWLPSTYSASAAPVAAMLALMTKIGIYVILRLWFLNFSSEAGASAFFGQHFLFYAGMASLIFSSIALLASQEPLRIASFSAMISSSILLISVSFQQTALSSALLYYFISSTLVIGALLLLTELMQRIRKPSSNILAITMEAFAIEDSDESTEGVLIPVNMAFLGLAFVACALVVTGFPPLSGFIAKFSLLHALLNENTARLNVSQISFFTLIILSGLIAIISFMRFGVRTFWSTENQLKQLPLSEVGSVYFLLFLCVAMTVFAGPLFTVLDTIAGQINTPAYYIDTVLGSQP